MLDEDIQQSLDEWIGFIQLFLKHGAADKDDGRAFFGPGPRHPGFGIDQRHFAENAPFADCPQHRFHAAGLCGSVMDDFVLRGLFSPAFRSRFLRNR